jgi:hypothetical protein
VLAPVPAVAQWVTVSFQDPAPPTMVWTAGGGGSFDLSPAAAFGTNCAPNVNWTYRQVPSGGFNNRGYYEQRWCSFYTSGLQGTYPSGWSGSGWRFEPGGTGTIGQNRWPDTFYGRLRIYIDTPILYGASGDRRRQLKFFIWHRDVYDGDQRVIGFLESGDNCGRAPTTHVCFTLQRNINNEDGTTVALSLDTWHHLQWSWRHGPLGVSFVKIWLNNNNESGPTAQDLNLNGVPVVPGGTTTWVKDNRGYDAPFNIGSASGSGSARYEADFVVRLMDFQLDGRFDPNYAQGTTAPPTAPSNLRILQ